VPKAERHPLRGVVLADADIARHLDADAVDAALDPER
jgi:hypothetical protein